MTTRPTLDSTPEDASFSKWTRDVEGFVENLIGSNKLPSAPAEVKVVSQNNSVKVTFRAVNEVGVSEYKIYRSTDKNFAGGNAEHVATVTQAINPAGVDLIYIDTEAVEKSFYFVSAVKGLRRPRLEGSVAGLGSATSGHSIGEGNAGGGTISGFSGIPGSILFVNEDSLIDQDNDNFFYSQSFKVPVAGLAGISWGPHSSPDIFLVRDAKDTLALKRGTNVQAFRVYEVDPVTSIPITSAVLLAEINESDLTVYTTSSISPSANKLILCSVQAVDLGFSGPITVNGITGAGLTWVKVAEVQYNSISGPRITQAVFRALGGAPTSGALTVTLDGPAAEAGFLITEYGNVDTGGSNGADAVVQFKVNSTDSGTSIMATLSAFSNSENATYGTFAGGGFGATWTEGSGFSKTTQTPLPPGTLSAMVQFRVDNDTTVNASHSASADDLSVIAIEIKSSFQGESRYIELFGIGASGGAEVMAVTGSGATDKDLIVGTRGASSLRLFVNNIESVRLNPSGVGTSSFLHSQSFTSDGTGTGADLHKLSGVLTGADEDTVALFGMDVDPTIVTQTATENIANIASLNIEEPKVTDNLTGDITVASTVRIAGAPDEGLTNWALNVVSGDVIFGGNLAVEGIVIIQGPLLIDVDDSEAILVRKDGDSGDVFQVDTVTPNVNVRNATFNLLGSAELIIAQAHGHGIATAGSASIGFHMAGTIVNNSPQTLRIQSNLSPGINTSAFAFIIAGVNYKENSSGIHAELNGIYIGGASVTAGGAAVTNTAQLHIVDVIPAIGANQYAIWVESGLSLVQEVTAQGAIIGETTIAQSNVTEGGTAQVVYKTAHEVHTLANANTSDTTTISIPAGAKLLGASFNVNTAVVDDGGDDTWSASFITGASESLASGAAASLNTKVNSLTANDEVATATTQIRFTANGGNFTDGVIEIVVYYMELTSLSDV